EELNERQIKSFGADRGIAELPDAEREEVQDQRIDDLSLRKYLDEPETGTPAADLHYTGPTSRPEAGLPIGNGRMGSLIWTTPTALHLQINRVDVFGCDASTNSFPQRHSDYCAGCAFVDIDLSEPYPPFSANSTTQHLSCFDGLATIDHHD